MRMTRPLVCFAAIVGFTTGMWAQELPDSLLHHPDTLIKPKNTNTDFFYYRSQREQTQEGKMREVPAAKAVPAKKPFQFQELKVVEKQVDMLIYEDSNDGQAGEYPGSQSGSIEGPDNPVELRASFMVSCFPFVFALVHKANLLEMPDGSYLLDTNLRLGHLYQLCPSERYVKEPVVSFCTAFALDNSHLATAGHCLSSYEVSDFYAVSGYRMIDERRGIVASHIAAGEVYAIEEIVPTPSNIDVGILKLGRKIPQPMPYTFCKKSMGVSEQVFGLGHPLGLPLKQMTESSIRSVDSDAYYCSLNAYQGCSGAPVFSENSFELSGMIVDGAIDFEQKGNCNVSRKCFADCRGERVLRIEKIQSLFLK